MNAISSMTSNPLSTSQIVASQKTEKGPGDTTAREAFQDFVAGTFYQQILKALRSTQEKPAYFHGGQAEEMFQSQLDQQVAEDLAKTNGGTFADQLYQSFSRQVMEKNVGVAGGQVAAAYADA